jgi:hypothetical protein
LAVAAGEEADVKIVRLERGALAPVGADRISVSCLQRGQFEFHGVSTVRNPYPARPVVTSSMNPTHFPSVDLAIAAGVEWAEQHKVEDLFVEFPSG